MKFKNEQDKELFFTLHPALIMIYSDLYNYTLEKYGINLIITQTVSSPQQDKELKRVSRSHLCRCAIDISVSNLQKHQIDDMCSYVNNNWRFKKYRYMSKSGIHRLAYFHTGNAPHIHLAIHAKYFLTPLFQN